MQILYVASRCHIHCDALYTITLPQDITVNVLKCLYCCLCLRASLAESSDRPIVNKMQDLRAEKRNPFMSKLLMVMTERLCVCESE